MDVRIAVPEDFEAIYRSNNKSNPKENSAWFPPSVREDISCGRVIFDPQSQGFCNFYPTSRGEVRVTIYNIFVPKEGRGQGAGKRMVNLLRSLYPDRPILAKCPAGIPANEFYKGQGWVLREVLPPEGRRKATLNLWVWEPENERLGI